MPLQTELPRTALEVSGGDNLLDTPEQRELYRTMRALPVPMARPERRRWIPEDWK